MNLKPESLVRIEKQIANFPVKRSAVLPLLHIVQEDQGYISKEAIEWIAQKLELQPINVYELLSFYPMLRDKPIGKTHVKVCRTLSCALRGGYATCDKLQEELKCPLGGTSDDGEFTIEFVECLASCHTAPVVQVDEVLHHYITPEKVAEFAKQLRKENAQKPNQSSRH
jgi:NADH-quinone oxidoreductase subunit E